MKNFKYYWKKSPKGFILTLILSVISGLFFGYEFGFFTFMVLAGIAVAFVWLRQAYLFLFKSDDNEKSDKKE